MKYKFFLVMIMVLFTVQLSAQNTQNFSLEQAVSTALSNNKSIKAALLDSEINTYKKGELNAALYPNINGSAGVNHFIDLPQQFLPASFLNPQAPDGEVVGVQFGVPNSANVGISAQWLIYNQAVFTGYKLLKAQSEMTDISIEKQKDEVAYSVTQLYYGVAFAKEQQKLLLENVASLDKLLTIVESNYKNGLITKVSVDKVQVNKTNVVSQLENLDIVIASQENFLKMLMGLPIETAIALTDEFDGTTLDLIVKTNIQPNEITDYQLLRKQLTLTELERKTLKANYLPTVGLAYNYQYNWQSENFSDLVGTDLKYPQQSIGLQVSVPIFDGRKNEFKLRQNEVKTLQLQQKADYLSDKITVDITNAQLKYNQNIEAIKVRNDNTKVAQSVLTQTTLEYQQGIVSLTEVINSETALREAQTQYLSAVSNALNALLEYKKVTNQL